MVKSKLCRICNKRFPNGKAMGGHMRSHLAKLPISPKPNAPPMSDKPTTPTDPKSSSSSSSSSSSASPASRPPTRKRRRNYRSINELMALTAPIGPVQGEAETEAPRTRETGSEAPRNSTRRRSKRGRKSVQKLIAPLQERERVSSLTEILPVEEAARCLLMLSKGMCKIEEKQVQDEMDHQPAEEKEEGDDQGKDDDDDDDEPYCLTRAPTKAPRKYKCEPCNKNFPSYQALGGHRANHKTKKIKLSVEEDKQIQEGSGNPSGAALSDAALPVVTSPDAVLPVVTSPDAALPVVASLEAALPVVASPDAALPVAALSVPALPVAALSVPALPDDVSPHAASPGAALPVNAVGVSDPKGFRCTFCEEVFESGQALDGHKHKEVHLSCPPTAEDSPKPPRKLLDLNLPAPEEDNEEEVKLSTGSAVGMHDLSQ